MTHVAMEGGDASIPVREVKSPESKIQDWNIPPQFASALRRTSPF